MWPWLSQFSKLQQYLHNRFMKTQLTCHCVASRLIVLSLLLEYSEIIMFRGFRYNNCPSPLRSEFREHVTYLWCMHSQVAYFLFFGAGVSTTGLWTLSGRRLVGGWRGICGPTATVLTTVHPPGTRRGLLILGTAHCTDCTLRPSEPQIYTVMSRILDWRWKL